MSIVSVDNIQPIGSGTSVTVNSAATLVLNNVNSTGVVTATTFVGNLTGTSSGNAVLTGSTNNQLVTVTGANAIIGESGLTWDGSTLLASGSDAQLRLYDSTASSENSALRILAYNGVNYIQSGKAFTSDSKADLIFSSYAAVSEWLRIKSDGKVGISESNPSNQLHISGTTSTSAGGLLRLDATDGDNFILFDNTNNNTEWAVGYDALTRNRFDMWYDTNGSNYQLYFSVDGATGAVRKPKNPVFIAYRVSNYSLTTTETELVYDSEKIDVGGNYNPSNGRFTAPVTGLYEFAYASIAHNTNTVYRYTLKVNGNDPYSPLRMELRIHNASSEYGTNGEFVVYVNMTAGQHASVYAKSDTNVSNTYGSSNYGYTYFRGRLIG
tara:strand:+ start:1506 stop:2651 length:1146 start_codon:yes stop_codon:yes gene_type:complete